MNKALNLVWVYTVSWCLSFNVSEPCPQSKPTPDEFGRMPPMGIVDAVYCFKTVKECDHIKRFESITDARAFILRAKKQSDVTDIKLDSLQELRGE